MRRYWLILILALALVAAACSGDNEDSTPPAAATQPAEGGDGLSPLQQAVADKIAASYSTEVAVSDEQARCTAEISTAGFSDERLTELGIDAESIPDRGFTWGNYDLTEPEASTVVDATLACMDRQNLATAFLASHGFTLEEATCIAATLANDEEALHVLITQTLLGDDDEAASEILGPLVLGCIDLRDDLAEMLVMEGISPESAQCVADGMPDEIVEMMLEGRTPEGDEELIEFLGQLMELQNRCLTPEELEAMSAFQAPDFQPAEPVEAPGPDANDPLASNRRELADTFARLVLGDELVTSYMTRQEIICLAEGAFSVFTDQRLGELGLNPESFTEAYLEPGLFVFGDWFDISDQEAFDLENLALGCVDWRNFVVEVLLSEGEPLERAKCIASEISVDGLREVVRDAMVVDTGEGFGAAQDEVASALTSCYLNSSSVEVS